MTPRGAARLAASAVLALFVGAAPPKPPQFVLWAWERPEDLRFLPPGTEIAVLVGHIELSGARVEIRGRRFPLMASGRRVTTAVVHIEIDPRRPLAWTPQSRDEVAAAVLDLTGGAWVKRVQVDFEVRASQRPVLLSVLKAVRAELPPETALSMTALASWCMTEDWLGEAPVDEVAPMLFRMGRGGERVARRLASGGDFAHPKCRTALALSTDTPIARIPPGRRVYLFNPRSWTAADFAQVARRLGR